MGTDDIPALMVVALCLRELSRLRSTMDAAVSGLREDLRAVLTLLTSQLGGSALEFPGSVGPSQIPTGAGATGLEAQRERVEDHRQGAEQGAGVQEDTGAPRVAQAIDSGRVTEVGHKRRYRPTPPPVA